MTYKPICALMGNAHHSSKEQVVEINGTFYLTAGSSLTINGCEFFRLDDNAPAILNVIPVDEDKSCKDRVLELEARCFEMEQVLDIFLGADETITVALAGNPTRLDEFMDRARAALKDQSHD